ncbi:MAG: Glyoxalase/bleomycin resistance protein/dioxygenase [Candidatus Woesebacteria bacterium GW2011_GWA1_37_8]|uniref:Glyoxalase/bleomycin resistance protein/dioxygenase n=2 Tax=Candidatus Woeseibacteriota TaxID=1752722 RepID=A0A0G0LFG3_9BACT|nr:MAG: Glyoxalase/bleomycin resistance protein/dioxygenase [Microgenomates group bacterium GW2011_GWC1_37_12b]KKQ45787.1 MAG: Glyoxalase/bleomycin resistance protein/dioxygenase [Candidatus Woesebacteria bacterium GW2011_GWA1_37_8]KKQ86675.1 MAG: Glyoxalase/bleomycin resistance protein/dioxygenase [Candidatus Woesebacteria bacterium GW2011_GWB1_38_8b]
MKFGHVAIRVKDIGNILDFYCKGLGLQEAFRINNDDGSLRIVYLHISEGQYLEICLGGEDRPAFDDQKSLGVRHVCFTVDDLAKLKIDAEKRGVVFDSDILDTRDHNKYVWLFDPEGNKLEIVQTMPDSPHKKFEESLE